MKQYKESILNDQSEILSTAHHLVQTELEALKQLRDQLDGEFCRAVTAINNRRGNIFLSGVGKSGLIAHKIAKTLVSLGIPAYSIHAGEAGHGDLGMIQPQDQIILISFSGTTVEVIKLLYEIKSRGCFTIAITGDKTSILAQESDVVLHLPVKREDNYLGVVPTTSALATLALGDALAVALAELRQVEVKDVIRNHPNNND